MVQAIAETGSMTGAARLLGISQPAISQHLRRAESRLGLELIFREGRTVRLAEAGQVICAIAPGISQSLVFATERLKEIRGLSAGHLRLSGFSAITETMIPTLISRLHAEYPALVVDYVEREPGEATEAIFAGECDVALVYRSPRTPFRAAWYVESEVVYRHVFDEEQFIALPASHPLADAADLDIDQLRDEDWILPTEDALVCVYDVLADDATEVRTHVTTDNISASLRFVSKGFGVAMIPQLALEAFPVPNGAKVRRLRSQPTRAVEVVTLSLHTDRPVVTALVRAVRAMRRSAATDPRST